jgi:antitoxin PrlF
MTSCRLVVALCNEHLPGRLLAIRKTVRQYYAMPKRRTQVLSYSRVSVKSQTVLPKQIREALDVKPGDTLRYRITDDGVFVDKAPARSEADDPFATFTEWSGSADDDL